MTIRTRVALWYAAVVIGVLLLVMTAMLFVYERIGVARIDDSLASSMQTLNGVVVDELAEEPTLAEAAAGAVRELGLPGVGFAILDPSGALLATRSPGVAGLSPEQLRREVPGAPAHTDPALNLRIAASAWTRGTGRYVIVAWTSLQPFERERATLRNAMLMTVPFAACAAMLGAWLIARRALRPLTAMVSDATTIDQTRLDSRLSVASSRDELSQLAVAFNAVLDRLAGVVQSQRHFMADASHELRTPVSIARTAAQVTLGGDERTEAEYRESLDIIADQMQRVTRMVDDMFLLTLADIDARPLERRDFYLNDVVADCVRAANVLAASKGLAIDVAMDSRDIAATGDEGLVREMVMNLLDNAIRHTPAHGHVTVTVADGDGAVELAIEDSGPGIPPAFHGRVFDRFVRLDSAGAGAGLGLSIAKWIAEQHGWQLRVDGEGRASSRFVLTLPDATTSAAD
jgi:heavy metal sensor kinase